MNILKHSFFLLLLIAFCNTSMAQERNPYIPDEIIKALKAGNSRVLAKHFNANIELLILENEDVYSQAQAEQIIKNFFLKYKPTNFSILHQSGKGESRYAIGNLTASGDKFRVYFLIKMNNNTPLIHQLSIEKDSNG